MFSNKLAALIIFAILNPQNKIPNLNKRKIITIYLSILFIPQFVFIIFFSLRGFLVFHSFILIVKAKKKKTFEKIHKIRIIIHLSSQM
jgi:hypothetical protein